MLELLVTIKPQPRGALHAGLSMYATRVYDLASLNATHYRIPTGELAGVTSILQRAFENGLIEEVYIRPQQEVNLAIPDEAYDPIGENVIWQEREESESKGKRRGGEKRMGMLGWRVSPPTYSLPDLLREVRA